MDTEEMKRNQILQQYFMELKTVRSKTKKYIKLIYFIKFKMGYCDPATLFGLFAGTKTEKMMFYGFVYS